MIRLICGGVIAICVAYIGLGIKKYYSGREKFFARLIDFIDALSQNVNYLKKPLPELAAEFASENKGECNRVIGEYGKLLLKADYQAIINIRTPLLKSSERTVFIEMLSGLGKSDSKTESERLKGYRAKFETLHSAAAKQSSTTGTLVFKLAVLLGVVILIILA